MLPEYTQEALGDLYFHLGYIMHGGSGLGLSPSEVDRLPIGEAIEQAERLNEQRKKEAAAIRSASRPKGG